MDDVESSRLLHLCWSFLLLTDVRAVGPEQDSEEERTEEKIINEGTFYTIHFFISCIIRKNQAYLPQTPK